MAMHMDMNPIRAALRTAEYVLKTRNEHPITRVAFALGVVQKFDWSYSSSLVSDILHWKDDFDKGYEYMSKLMEKIK